MTNEQLARELYAVYDTIWTRQHSIREDDAAIIMRAVTALKGESEPVEDRSIKAVIERLRFGDSDGDDHDIAAAELERLAADAAAEKAEAASWKAVAHDHSERLKRLTEPRCSTHEPVEIRDPYRPRNTGDV